MPQAESHFFRHNTQGLSSRFRLWDNSCHLLHSSKAMAKETPLQFKGTTLNVIQTQLRTGDASRVREALDELTGNAPDFFDGELAVLDLRQADPANLAVDWANIIKLLRQSGLQPVAACGIDDREASRARAAGLAVLPVESLNHKPNRPAPETPAPAQAAAPAAEPASPPPAAVSKPQTVILDKPLRSGQRFYAKDSDLVVMAMVSAGAEVIADGNIHVYAPLRGRALAGASGNASARIFTTSLEAELLSIAGIYRTFDSGLPTDLARQAVMVRLNEEGSNQRLQISSITIR